MTNKQKELIDTCRISIGDEIQNEKGLSNVGKRIKKEILSNTLNLAEKHPDIFSSGIRIHGFYEEVCGEKQIQGFIKTLKSQDNWNLISLVLDSKTGDALSRWESKIPDKVIQAESVPSLPEEPIFPDISTYSKKTANYVPRLSDLPDPFPTIPKKPEKKEKG